MNTTIEKLWNGSIRPCEEYCGNNPQIQEVAALMDRHKQALYQSLSKEQVRVLEKFIDCSGEYSYLAAEHAFRSGFSLACRLLSEAFSSD